MQYAIKQAGKRDQFQITQHLAARRQDLQRALLDTDEEQPLILHLASNGKGEGFMLAGKEGEPELLSATKLATLLELFEHLEVVIMSGCYEESQARAISELGVMVIGIGSDLNPKHRIVATTSIYDALGSGWEAQKLAKSARAAVHMEDGDPGQIIMWQEGKMVSFQKKKQPKPAEPESAKAEGLLSELLTRPLLKLSNHHAFFCDRVGQDQEFLGSFASIQTDTPFHFYIIHGDDPQSHSGLFKRFFHAYLYSSNEPVASQSFIEIIEEAPSLTHYQALLRSRLLGLFSLQHLYIQLATDAEQWEAICDRLHQQKAQNIAIEFKVRSSSWKEFTPDLLRWFIQQYCAAAKPPEGMRFYFFLSIVYEREVDHMILLDQIQKQIKGIPLCTTLSELHPVTIPDVRTWIERHLTQQPKLRDDLLRRAFPQQRPKYDMSEVEVRLDDLIKQLKMNETDPKQ